MPHNPPPPSLPGVALLVVDVQNDFLTGSLPVPGGQEVVPAINGLLNQSKYQWDLVVASQDFHPAGHVSFASSHPGEKLYDTIEVDDARGFRYEQKLWPDHCIQGTNGAEIARDLEPRLKAYGDKFKVIRKGWHKGIEAYSAFDGYASDGNAPADPPTEIDPQPARKIVKLLRDNGIGRVVVVGVATDYCVAHTALSAFSAHFDTAIYVPAVRAVSDNDGNEVLDKLEVLGGKVIGRHKADRWSDELRAWLNQ